MEILLVGGVFDDGEGRASSYCRQLNAAIVAALGEQASVAAINGGHFDDLRLAMDSAVDAEALLWMGDIPNDKPKLVNRLQELRPGLRLIISKNNRARAYSVEQLAERMALAGACALIEFQNDEAGLIKARLMGPGGAELAPWSSKIDDLAAATAAILDPRAQELP
jgi:hypothetical protein